MFGVTATVQGYLSEEPRDEDRLTAQRISYVALQPPYRVTSVRNPEVKVG